MNIKKGLILKEIAGNYVVVAIGNATKDLSGVITLNETGAFLWKLLESGADEEYLFKQLVSNFNVDNSTAENDVKDFIERLKEKNVLA